MVTGAAARRRLNPSTPLFAQSSDPTATPSFVLAAALFPRTHCGLTDAQAALLVACELLRYRPAGGDYDAWLNRVAELLDAACGACNLFSPTCVAAPTLRPGLPLLRQPVFPGRTWGAPWRRGCGRDAPSGPRGASSGFCRGMWSSAGGATAGHLLARMIR